MNNTTIYKSVTDGHNTWQIIKKNGVYHWRGSKRRCWNCPKVAFDYKEVAELYSRYMFMKHGIQQRTYWDDCCEVWHLTTSHTKIWVWT
jgi:hypothetical protein